MSIRYTIERIFTDLNIPYKYRVFKGDERPPMPFAVYSIGREVFSGSDERLYIKESTVTIQIVTSDKDWNLEELLEEKISGLDDISSDISKDEDYDTTEEAYVITYEFTLTTKIRR